MLNADDHILTEITAEHEGICPLCGAEITYSGGFTQHVVTVFFVFQATDICLYFHKIPPSCDKIEKAKTETRCTKIAMCTAVVIDGGMADEEMGRNNHRNTFQDSFG